MVGEDGRESSTKQAREKRLEGDYSEHSFLLWWLDTDFCHLIA